MEHLSRERGCLSTLTYDPERRHGPRRERQPYEKNGLWGQTERCVLFYSARALQRPARPYLDRLEWRVLCRAARSPRLTFRDFRLATYVHCHNERYDYPDWVV